MDNHRQPSLQDLGVFLVNSSHTRWLAPEEIYLLLVLPPAELGISPLKFPPPIIKDGTLCVYEDGALCKQDNISWARKKGQAKLQETYSTLKIHGAELIKAVYIRGHDNANFRRRIYKLNQPDKAVTIVHYRECPDDEKVEKTHLHAIVHFFLHRHLLPSYKAPAVPQQPQHHDSQMVVDIGRSGDGDHDIYFDEILHDLADESAAGNPADQQYNGDDQKMTTEREMIEIIEFAPTKLNSNENERKLLVCISHALFSSQWKVVFSSEQQQIAVPIMSVLPGVIKLHVPILNNGLWKLFLINEYDEKISYDSWENFVAFSTDEPRRTLGKRSHSITSTTLQQGRSDYEDAAGPSSGRYASLEPQSSFHSTGNGNSGMNDDFGRESKIRIVEKLESMKSALLGEDAAPSAFLSPHGIAPVTLLRGESMAMSEVTTTAGGGEGTTDGVEWLDDTQLSTLSNSELESLMERYIMAVVKELVQLAAVDDDLKAEMDSLDANGYSLFHYCCLYNLTSLIPVLIARGVEINQATASGSTALHLAVAAGHIAVAQLLLDSGVDAMKLDADGMTAYDISVTTGQEDIARLLFPLFENTAIDPSADPIQATTVTPKKRLPTLPYSASSVGTPDGEGTYDRDGTITTASTTTAAPGSVSSQRLLHDAFATLSLTDKCALSISLSQLTPKTPATASAGHKSAERITGIVPSSGSRAMNNNSNSGLPPQPLSLPPPPPVASSVATIHGFDGQRTSSDDHSSAASLSNHQDYAVMAALQELDTSYVDMLMGDDQSTTSCSLPSTSAMFPPFPDTYASTAYAHGAGSDGGNNGFAPGDRSPSSVSSAMGIPRATSGSSVLGFSASSSSTSSLAAPSTSSNLSSSVLHKHNTTLANGAATTTTTTGKSGSSNSGKRATEDLSDIQSVISESDKVSLDKAMSLMGQQELIQVEEEVRKIQNNVRGWLLRKNYVNLREAARSLQVAWREKRSRSNSAPPPLIPMATGHSPRMNGGGGGGGSGGGGGGGSLGIAAPGSSSTSSSSVSVGTHSRSHSITLHGSTGPVGIPAVRSHLASSPSTSGKHGSVSHPPPPSSSTPQGSRRDSRLHENAMDADDDDDENGGHIIEDHLEEDRNNTHDDSDRNGIEEKAAATLQAATRRMIARRSFANLHKHTMASLTIQRNLVRWWTRHSRSSSNAEPMDPNYVMTAEPSHVYVPTYYHASSSMSGDPTNAHSAANHAFPFPYR